MLLRARIDHHMHQPCVKFKLMNEYNSAVGGITYSINAVLLQALEKVHARGEGPGLPAIDFHTFADRKSNPGFARFDS